MNGNEILLAVLLVVVLPMGVAILERLVGRITHGAWAWKASENMPSELRDAEVFMNESSISMPHPFVMHGRVDQVFKTRRGRLVVLDTKYRLRMQVTEGDVLQISCYAIALRQRHGSAVAGHGYIRLVCENGGRRTVRYARVRLLSERTVQRRLLQA